jgi:(methylthio)acryloyl-CoA hydratase
MWQLVSVETYRIVKLRMSSPLTTDSPVTFAVAVADGIGTVTLNRPQKRNAMNERMISLIANIFIRPNPGLRAYVITAQGDHFSSGLDLTEHVQRSPQEVMDISAFWHRATQLIVDSPVPVICGLKGYVVGAGLELASAAHVRFMEPDCKFSLPEGRRGIFVGGGASVRVGRLIGVSRLTEMMLSGRNVDADEALRIGLCQRLSAPGKAARDAHAYAVEVSGNAPLSNRMILSGLRNIAEMSSSAGLFTESLAAALTQTSPEATERINAFFAKSSKA